MYKRFSTFFESSPQRVVGRPLPIYKNSYIHINCVCMYVCIYAHTNIWREEVELVYLNWEGFGRRERWEEEDRE